MSERQLFSNANNHVPHVVHSTSSNLLDKSGVSPRSKWTLRQKIHLSITITLFLLCLILIAIYIREVTVNESKHRTNAGTGVTNRSASSNDIICYDAGCIQTAARILTSIDEKEDPCHDFYKHACGGWFKKNSIPDNNLWWDTFAVLEAENVKLYKKILEEKNASASEATIKLRTLYHTCKNEIAIKKLGIKPLQMLVEDCQCDGSDKKWDMVVALAQIHRYFAPYLYGPAGSPLFETQVIVDKTRSSRYIVQISQPNLILTSLKRNSHTPFGWINSQDGSYLKSSTDFLRKLYANRTKDIWKLEKDVRKFHDKLQKIAFSTEKLRDVKSMYQVLKVSQLNKETGRQFPWLRYLNAVLKPVGIKMNKSSLVATKPLQYLQGMAKIVKDTPNETLNYYFLWTLVNAFGKYTLEPDEKTNPLVMGPRWRRCVKIVEEFMGMALGAIYVKLRFEKESIGHIEGMASEIKETFIDNLRTLDWMDEKTKLEAKAKAKKMATSIGYPDFLNSEKKVSQYYSGIEIYTGQFFRNIVNLQRFLKLKNLNKLWRNVDRDEWSHPPTLVNAFYDVGRNKMIFFAGILHSPFYSRKGSMSLNYGSLGTVMGHEFSHGFDDQGRLYDSNGNIHDWWTPESSKSFEEKAKCIAKQYSTFSYSGVYLNGNATLGENLADNIGVKIAFKAYKRWISKHGVEAKLPGIKFDGEQLFFLGYAQMWCSLEKAKALMYGMGTHSPNMFRVFGSLQNSVDFAKVFKCKKDSRMNPKEKCSIW